MRKRHKKLKVEPVHLPHSFTSTHKLLEDKVFYDQINETAKQLEATINQCFGGYLRQPIKLYLGDSKHQRYVTGNCALNDNYCIKQVPIKDGVDLCWYCSVYKTMFEGEKE